ncbi:MAG TPA: tRNA (guanosine(37)-N1)-methyltransferase TrmD [Burkholderiaceae bacterium]|nr:tRNA (guanosine(37)-N1)-methyltransferase TrmD [Burkholderiaceae bacterium]
MEFEVVTIFPEMVETAARFGVTGRALERGIWRLRTWNPRDFTEDAYRSIDDRPYGGGPGMVMLAEPLDRCLGEIAAARSAAGAPPAPVVHLTPSGAPLTQARVAQWAGAPALTLLCGRYEAVDQRLIDARVDEEVSIGDFVVSGGELPALLLIDAVTRLLPGVMQHESSVRQDSFGEALLDWPHFTRPETFGGVPVPPVLLSGHHQRIARWRREQALRLTAHRRPDLIERARAEGRLSADDERFLQQLGRDGGG